MSSSRTAHAAFPAVGLLLGFVLLGPSLAHAQDPGLRAGVSVDPDQFYVGGHFDFGPVVERLRFRPNLEIGFGDDLTLLAVNFEFLYPFPLRQQPWSLYVGGGPAINVYSRDSDGNNDDDTDVEPGLNILFGVEHRRGLFFEFKVGTIDSPDLKFGIGYTFR
jgi:hypothetical protein